MPNPDLPKSTGYRAEQNDDGTWNIRDVPVFSEIPAGTRGNQMDIGKDWLMAAVDRAQARFSEKYVAPTHVNHHKGAKGTKRAGFFMPHSVRPHMNEGKLVWTVFADILSVPAGIFEDLERGEIPYRSVEVHDWNVPEINSLALLDDEVPFFRFEIMSIANKQPAEANFAVGITPALATFAAGEASRRQFLFGEDNSMPDPDETPEVEESPEVPPTPEVNEGEEPGEGMSFEDRVLDGLDKLQSAVMQLMQDDDEEKPADPDSAPVEEEEPEEEPASANLSADNGNEIAMLSAENRALRDADKKRKRKEKVTSMVASAERDLVGFELDDETRQEMHTFATKGQDALDAFVASYKRVADQDPPSTLGDFEANAGEGTVPDPNCVMQFANRGADDLEKARAAAAKHAELSASCPNFTVPLETFVAQEVDGVSLGR